MNSRLARGRPSFGFPHCLFTATVRGLHQKLGGTSRMILAGQVSYDGDAPLAHRHGCSTGPSVPVPPTALVPSRASWDPSEPTFEAFVLIRFVALAARHRTVLRYGANCSWWDQAPPLAPSAAELNCASPMLDTAIVFGSILTDLVHSMRICSGRAARSPRSLNELIPFRAALGAGPILLQTVCTKNFFPARQKSED